jgi:Protein of unknown function (DUF3421)
MRRCGSSLITIAILLTVYQTAEALVGGRWVCLPADGLVTGKGGGRGPLAVCRSSFDGGQHAGKLWEGQCNFGWGGKEYRDSNFEVLLDSGYTWINPGQLVNTSWGQQFIVTLPNNAVDGGDAGNAAGHVRLGICQAFVASDSTWHPGKFYANICNIAWGGKERLEYPDGQGSVLVLVK